MAPLFLASTVLAIGGFVVASVIAGIKRHNQLQDSSEEQTQWFRDLSNDGLLRPDWFDKLEFLRYAWSTYGNDNIDTGNQSYFQFQSAEWAQFLTTPGEDGSSLRRLQRQLHVDTYLTSDDEDLPRILWY